MNSGFKKDCVQIQPLPLTGGWGCPVLWPLVENKVNDSSHEAW